MTHQPGRLTMLLVALLLFLSACSPGVAESPPPGDLAATMAMRTRVAQLGMEAVATATPTAAQNTPAEGPTNFRPAATLPATETPVPSLTPVRYQVSDKEPCTNLAEFVKDLSIPDETVLLPGEKFTKVWQFRNAGTCTWTPEYSLVFVWGELMNGETPKPLAFEVLPGELANIALELVTPKFPDYYQGNWMFANPDGDEFGTGARGKNFFWVSIIAGVPGFGGSSFSPCGPGG